MEIGVSVPIVEIGDDFGALRDYIQAAEDLGYAHVRILDHVLGAVPEKHPEVPNFPYSHESYIHEPFTLMAYLAAVTKKIGLTTGILILPQRQTALVAKQAAEVDVLSGGRVRLGIGVGWNSVEYEALGVDFATRGSRCDEQIEVLRQLWTEDVIDFHGKYHDITTPASTRCRCSDPSPSGSALAVATRPRRPTRPSAASDVSPTDTSPCLPPTPAGRRSWAASARRPRPPAATRRRSASRDASPSPPTTTPRTGSPS